MIVNKRHKRRKAIATMIREAYRLIVVAKITSSFMKGVDIYDTF